MDASLLPCSSSVSSFARTWNQRLEAETSRSTVSEELPAHVSFVLDVPQGHHSHCTARPNRKSFCGCCGIEMLESETAKRTSHSKPAAENDLPIYSWQRRSVCLVLGQMDSTLPFGVTLTRARRACWTYGNKMLFNLCIARSERLSKSARSQYNNILRCRYGNMTFGGL